MSNTVLSGMMQTMFGPTYMLASIKVGPNGKMPQRATEGSAGFDLYAAENYVITPQSRGFVSLDLCIAIPEGFYGRIASRSGLAKKGIDVGAGTIDSDYRGDVKVLLCNNSRDTFHVMKGDRIAQLIIEKCYYLNFVETDDLNKTQRGEGGFGSTGKN